MDRSLLPELNRAIRDYDFPPVTYDFASGHERRHASMASVEAEIQRGLTSTNLKDVMAALSNVLFWGYYRVGYRDVRVRRFREQVTREQLQAATGAFSLIHGPGLRTIHELDLPEFSGMSFISKVRMFLDPGQYVILDRKLLTLQDEPEPNVFKRIAMSPKETQIGCPDRTRLFMRNGASSVVGSRGSTSRMPRCGRSKSSGESSTWLTPEERS